MTIAYPVRGIHENEEEIDAAIIDNTGRALNLDEIIAALNEPKMPDAPPGYRYELIRLATPEEEAQLDKT